MQLPVHGLIIACLTPSTPVCLTGVETHRRRHQQGAIFNEMRSKTKVLQEELGFNPADYPDWSFDGSSTGQASGDNSDCILKCVHTIPSAK